MDLHPQDTAGEHTQADPPCGSHHREGAGRHALPQLPERPDDENERSYGDHEARGRYENQPCIFSHRQRLLHHSEDFLVSGPANAGALETIGRYASRPSPAEVSKPRFVWPRIMRLFLIVRLLGPVPLCSWQVDADHSDLVIT